MKTGRQIILEYNQQDHQSMGGFKELPELIDEALAEARKQGADWGIRESQGERKLRYNKKALWLQFW
jgi:hypothetical protein